ncbi:hypothetical protein DID80_00605 [Candidatus Marinamargulisbacteria bacterium SCGC AAA071-K20]|nr:hypothetical protein DID80_00605 [Candidatus Marinamargulisbacteria bacterium SCGC AAA071-K20]
MFNLDHYDSLSTQLVIIQNDYSFSCSGHIDCRNKSEIESEFLILKSYIDLSPSRIVIDIANLEFINSIGLCVLQDLVTSISKKSIFLTLCVDSKCKSQEKLLSAFNTQINLKKLTLKDIRGVINLPLSSFSSDTFEIKAADTFVPFLSNDIETKEQLHYALDMADNNLTILITGETGTGKEALVRAIFQASNRAGKSTITQVSTLDNGDLFFAELFGYKKGAFTDATESKNGKVSECDKGMLAIDEFGELNPSMQAKLLQFTSDKRYEPLGQIGEDPLHSDVKLLLLTNKDLELEVRAGRFRQDLYERIKTCNIHLKPLRERKDDIELLFRYYVSKYLKESGKVTLKVQTDVLVLLQGYNWPGNIRELENITRLLVYSNKTGCIMVNDFNGKLTQKEQLDTEDAFNYFDMEQMKKEYLVMRSLKELVWDSYIEKYDHFMAEAHGDKKQVASIMDVSLRQVYEIEKIKRDRSAS